MGRPRRWQVRSSFLLALLSDIHSLVDPSTGNAANPGVSRFSEAQGATVSHGEGSEITHEDAAAAGAAGGVAAANQPQAYKPPFYLRRWFIVTGVVLGALGLALLFIILYPVVKAIAQLVVNRSVLGVDQVMITNPQNGS